LKCICGGKIICYDDMPDFEKGIAPDCGECNRCHAEFCGVFKR